MSLLKAYTNPKVIVPTLLKYAKDNVHIFLLEYVLCNNI